MTRYYMCCWCSWYWPTLSGITDDLSNVWQNSPEYCQHTGRERERERERERDRHCVKLAVINLDTDWEYNAGWYNYSPDRELKIFHLPPWWTNIITNRAKGSVDAISLVCISGLDNLFFLRIISVYQREKPPLLLIMYNDVSL